MKLSSNRLTDYRSPTIAYLPQWSVRDQSMILPGADHSSMKTDCTSCGAMNRVYLQSNNQG